MTALEQHAEQIPSMGGTAIGPFLRNIAKEAPRETAIVEVGTWLGAGTAQLALGVRDREDGSDVPIHCFDRWAASPSEVEKAAARGALDICTGQDTLAVTKRFLDPFGVPIVYHKGDIGSATWNDGPISVYVDDAAKTEELFRHVLQTFGPSWIPGGTILVLMDYFFWRKRSSLYKYQDNVISRYGDHFERIEHPCFNGTSGASFRYVKPMNFSVFKPNLASKTTLFGKRAFYRLKSSLLP